VLNAPRPLRGALFANPLVVMHNRGSARVPLLGTEVPRDVAARLGTRAAFHRTVVVREEGPGGALHEVDVAGPALDNYAMDPAGGAVPLSVTAIEEGSLKGWSQDAEGWWASRRGDPALEEAEAWAAAAEWICDSEAALPAEE